MAQRRMFSPDIVCSDAFLDMPASGRDLYYQLGMYADDDGFVNPRKIMRMLGSSEDDLKILVAKRFVLPFPSGVLVIKHWKINNLVRKDWYRPTQYVEEKATLITKENGAYTDGAGALPPRSRLVNEPSTVRPRRLGKVRLGKDTKPEPTKVGELGRELLKAFEEVDPKNKTYYGNLTQRRACDFLISEYGLEEVLKRVRVLAKTNKLPYFPSITTPVQLRDKWVQLQDAVERKRGEVAAKKPIIV